jgi:hypothetical protein
LKSVEIAGGNAEDGTSLTRVPLQVLSVVRAVVATGPKTTAASSTTPASVQKPGSFAVLDLRECHRQIINNLETLTPSSRRLRGTESSRTMSLSETMTEQTTNNPIVLVCQGKAHSGEGMVIRALTIDYLSVMVLSLHSMIAVSPYHQRALRRETRKEGLGEESPKVEMSLRMHADET